MSPAQNKNPKLEPKPVVVEIGHTETSDIKSILLKGNYVIAEDLEKASAWAKSNKSSIEEYLMTQGVITKDILGQAWSEFYKVPYADLNTKLPSREQVLKIPENMAVPNRIVLFAEDEAGITVATDNPTRAILLQSQLKIIFPPKTGRSDLLKAKILPRRQAGTLICGFR